MSRVMEAQINHTVVALLLILSFFVNGYDLSTSPRIYYKAGIVGGGNGSSIGALHLNAITLSRRARLVCGCFSSDPSKSKAAGAQYGLHRNRVYKE